MTQIAEVITLTLLNRSPEFVAELDQAEFVLIPAAMDRLKERDAEAVREQVLMATSHLAAHIVRLKSALENGEPDSFETERALEGYLLMKSATEYWRDAAPGNRWPNNPEAN